MNDLTAPQKGVQTINSVIHATEILELYASQRETYLSLTQISHALKMHKTTVYRILRTLQSVGWIEQSNETSQYRLGTGILLVSSAVAVHHSSRSLIAEEMRKLVRLHNETVVLSSLRGNLGICVDMVKSTHSLSISSENGYIVPLHIGATGKVLLAAQSNEVIARILNTMPPNIAETLKQQLSVVRRNGYCISEGEVDLGVAAVAIPLVLSDNIYTLTISGPVERLRQLDYSVLHESLRLIVDEIVRKCEGLKL